MRRGTQDAQVITSPIVESETGKSGGQVLGISLGWDFATEHESGINGIKEAFGLASTPSRRLLGADARTNTICPDELRFFPDLSGYAYLMFMESWLWRQGPEYQTAEYFDRRLDVHFRRDEEEFSTAWSEKDFGVRLKNDSLGHGRMVLGQIYDAFKKCDGMIFLGARDNPFGNSGLMLAVRSRLDTAVIKHMKAVDSNYLKLKKADEKTGVREKLKDAKLGYFALSPSWLAKDGRFEDVESSYPVVYWLNPYDQQKYNSGWFTVEQLLEWIDGKGPVLITAE